LLLWLLPHCRALPHPPRRLYLSPLLPLPLPRHTRKLA
jgi:hypothetical protein